MKQVYTLSQNLPRAVHLGLNRFKLFTPKQVYALTEAIYNVRSTNSIADIWINPNLLLNPFKHAPRYTTPDVPVPVSILGNLFETVSMTDIWGSLTPLFPPLEVANCGGGSNSTSHCFKKNRAVEWSNYIENELLIEIAFAF